MCPQAVPFRLEAQLEAWQDNLSACCPAPPPAVLALSTAAMTSDLWLKSGKAMRGTPVMHGVVIFKFVLRGCSPMASHLLRFRSHSL
jgi:hypothetical protein